jgi:MFS family permease
MTDAGAAPPTEDPRTSAVSPRATAVAVVLLTGMNLFNYIDRAVLPAVIEKVKRDIPMSDTWQGVALTAFVWVYMVTAPVFGRLGDRYSRKRLIALGVGLWSIATAAAAFATTLQGLIATRALVGVGEAAYATISPALIGDYYPRERRGKVMALFFLATPVGSALGYILGGSIASAHSWHAAFLAVGIPGLLLALGALFLHEPPRGQFDDAKPEPVPLRAVLPALRANREYLWISFGWTAYTFAVGGLAQWMPAFLIRERAMDGAYANNLFGVITVVTGIVGTLVGSAIAERLRGRVRHPYLLVMGVSTLVGTPFAVLAFMMRDANALWSMLFIAEFFVFMGTGPTNTALVNCLPVSVRATGLAVSIFLIHVLGDAISPTLIGRVSDATSLGFAVLLVPLAFAVAAAIWIVAQRRLPMLAHHDAVTTEPAP